jgi:Tfp pilus assembly protein PilN
MARKLLLYVTAWRATVYESQGASLRLLQSFPNDDEGYNGFAAFIKGVRSGLVYLLADLVEEDFHLELVPAVRGGDRRQLLARKLAQRYRDTSLSLSLSLGTERTQRRDERVLLSSFTNTQLVQPWLNVLRETDLALVGAYSVALMAPALVKRLGQVKAPCLLVSLQPAGLRQSLVTQGQIRFSRLGPLDPAEADQPARVAAAFAAETVRIHQYLTAVRVLPRDEAVLDVVLLAPAGRRALVQAAASDTPQLRYRVVDVAEAADAIGLKRYPQGAGAECLYLHLLANARPREQYLSERLRHNFRVWQGRMALLFGGAAAAGACVLVAAAQWWEIRDVREQVQRERMLARSLSEDYSRVTAKFPKIPTSSDNLRLTVQQYGALLKQVRYPDVLLSDVGAVLGRSPGIELESLRWEQAVLRERPRASAAAGAPVAPAPAGTADNRNEMLEISARVVGVPANDYRAVNDIVSAFIERLRAQAKVEIVSRRLPFDVGSETSLSGDVGNDRPAESSTFQLLVARKQTP